jgi:hypothetical protein
MFDKRYALKIKIKTLAAEAQIIRFEENRTINTSKKADLAMHRRGIVREAARNAQLAYGYVRGRSYHQLEAKCHIEPNWKTVKAMVEKYGIRFNEEESIYTFSLRKQQFLKDFDVWHDSKNKKAQVSAT